MNCKKRKAPSVCALSARELTAKTVPPQTEELFTPSAAGIGTKAMLPFKPGSAAKLCAALAAEKINIRMIDQGSSELNIIVAVATQDYERAINAIYHAFV